MNALQNAVVHKLVKITVTKEQFSTIYTTDLNYLNGTELVNTHYLPFCPTDYPNGLTKEQVTIQRLVACARKLGIGYILFIRSY